MYDHLDPLFFRQTPSPRHSEPVDTHMAIQRHEQSRGRRRRGRPPHEEAAGTTLWEDSTRMSVVMLRAFLQNLLAAQKPGRTSDQPEECEGAGESSDAAQNVHKAPDEQKGEKADEDTVSPARKAAHAYQSTARAVHDSNYDPWVATGPAIPDDAPALNEHEAEVVRQMIRDLERLEARYIETLEIKRTTNFLQAILDSIDHVMGRN